MSKISFVLLVVTTALAAIILWLEFEQRAAILRHSEEVSLLRLSVAQLEERLKRPEVPEQPTRRMAASQAAQASSDLRRYEVAIGNSPTMGTDSADIDVVAFSDFECPYCRRVAPTLETLFNDYGGKVRIVFKHYPLTRIHPNAKRAHIASEASHRQGRFWEFHDRIFSNPADLSAETLRQYAVELGLDIALYDRDIASVDVTQAVDRDISDAQSLGVRGTPAFIINGVYVSGARSLGSFKQIIDQELSRQ